MHRCHLFTSHTDRLCSVPIMIRDCVEQVEGRFKRAVNPTDSKSEL